MQHGMVSKSGLVLGGQFCIRSDGRSFRLCSDYDIVEGSARIALALHDCHQTTFSVCDMEETKLGKSTIATATRHSNESLCRKLPTVRGGYGAAAAAAPHHPALQSQMFLPSQAPQIQQKSKDLAWVQNSPPSPTHPAQVPPATTPAATDMGLYRFNQPKV